MCIRHTFKLIATYLTASVFAFHIIYFSPINRLLFKVASELVTVDVKLSNSRHCRGLYTNSKAMLI